MTVVTMVWVQEHVHEVRNATKAVLSYLAFKARYDDGTAAWPAIGTIAGACGLSEKTVQRSIDQLLDLGLIEPGQQNFSAINPKTGEPVRRNYQTIVWNVICKESNLPTEPCEDPSASKVRAAMKRAERAKAKMSPLNQTDQNDGESSDKMSGTADKKQTKRAKAKMSPLKNGGNKPILTDSDKMSPLESQDGTNDVVEDKMSEKLDKMSPNNTLKYNYPSLPTGELPASGKRPTGEDGKNETGRSSEAVTVMDHLTAIRSKLSLTTSTPTKRDHAKIGNLVSRVAKAHDADRAAAVALILAVIDPNNETGWAPSETVWKNIIYQQQRGEIAIGSGGIFGNGFFEGRYYSVPNAHNDFILCWIGNAAGFVGCCVVLGVLLAIIIKTFATGAGSEDMLGSFICAGIGGALMAQIFVNVGMNLRVLPVIGVTLPFYSAGGSSVLMLYICVGLVLSVYMHNTKKLFG